MRTLNRDETSLRATASSPIGKWRTKVLLVCRCNLQRNELTPPLLLCKVGTGSGRFFQG